MFNPLIISPPFGNIINLAYATSVCGTFTAQKRDGMYFRYLKTLRPVYKNGKNGWINYIGLRNPGIANLNSSKVKGKILSIALMDQKDMSFFLVKLEEYITNQKYNIKAIEINVSCPNAKVNLITNHEINLLKNFGLEIIIKIPPSKAYLDMINYYFQCGVRYFHLFNSFSTEKGGVSGKLIQKLYWKLIKKAKDKFGNSIKIIGGGGIQSIEDLQMYQQQGAEHFSISTLFLHPLKLNKFLNEYKK
jgi:dihydroorotate dehydrogenase